MIYRCFQHLTCSEELTVHFSECSNNYSLVRGICQISPGNAKLRLKPDLCQKKLDMCGVGYTIYRQFSNIGITTLMTN